VKRKTASFPVHNIDVIKQQMLGWINRFSICCFLDNHQYHSGHQTVECLAAAGTAGISSPSTNILQELKKFDREHNDWLFGHISYDLKNETEKLRSEHPDPIGFPVICFFRPQTVLQLKEQQLTISSLNEDPEEIYAQLQQQTATSKNEAADNKPLLPGTKQQTPGRIHSRISKQQYIATIQKLQQHIARGDCYEINFCQEFFSENATIDPLHIYSQLTGISPNPFSCYYRIDNKYLLCASPERYLQKKGNNILSQPIKGTFKRNTSDKTADETLKQQLQQSEKDRSENVMVVDLVRNDLSRVCIDGSVKVDELFGVYSFPQVHQMISTIIGELKEGTDLADILHATFPMGSMTGAPKKRVMELIEQYESTKRGIFSGAVGYISPEKDFDFNVVIRSILYNSANRYLSYLVGGGITAYSDPEKEYEECLLKAEAMQKVLQ
jgi:para-aminobenzoate synthetase component 1